MDDFRNGDSGPSSTLVMVRFLELIPIYQTVYREAISQTLHRTILNTTRDIGRLFTHDEYHEANRLGGIFIRSDLKAMAVGIVAGFAPLRLRLVSARLNAMSPFFQFVTKGILSSVAFSLAGTVTRSFFFPTHNWDYQLRNNAKLSAIAQEIQARNSARGAKTIDNPNRPIRRINDEMPLRIDTTMLPIINAILSRIRTITVNQDPRSLLRAALNPQAQLGTGSPVTGMKVLRLQDAPPAPIESPAPEMTEYNQSPSAEETGDINADDPDDSPWKRLRQKAREAATAAGSSRSLTDNGTRTDRSVSQQPQSTTGPRPDKEFAFSEKERARALVKKESQKKFDQSIASDVKGWEAENARWK